MPGESERISFAAVTPHRLAARIEQSLIEGGYTPAGVIVPPGKPIAEILRQSLAQIVFASPEGGTAFIASLLKAVRDYDRALPVVLIAEPSEEEPAIEAMQAGARDYILADHLHRLPAVVERELREARWRREHARFEARLQQTQRLESIGLLAGGVAHDFNNLLTVLQGCLEMLSGRQSEPRLQARVDLALETAARGARLVGQLLAFARRQPAAISRLDLNAQLRGMSEVLARTVGGGGAIESDLAADLWPVDADATQLQLSLINLAINARDAMPEGG
ncbi:MAG TPA: histidine kinase dimerization/phospho-acceptor domain-containing protein, partial [Bryobacteraceae bacterium]|nr:histidine kinase dimerization/phospho-acceptor domain-containing protein [Bryobacteraceae bacterium]